MKPLFSCAANRQNGRTEREQSRNRIIAQKRPATSNLPPMPILIYEHHITILSSDIDENDHANNLCYLRWMNEAARAHSAENGWTPQRYRDLGASWFARKHTIEYLAPSFKGDKLVVRTGVTDWHTFRSIRTYRFVRISDEKVIAKAETLWVFVNLSTGKPTRLPKEVNESFVVADVKEI